MGYEHRGTIIYRGDSSHHKAVVLSWLGGACDGNATIRFHVVHGDYLLNLATHHTADNCPALGVPRAVRITMSRAIPVESIVVAGSLP